ncbi:hypothetical protein BHM03_00037411 [Ensete ventricosum]|nr:hypothetical protein BHM03_00037411 [Ensete ventricosum]
MRSLDDVPRPLFLIALDEEKIAAKKSPPREVLLIRGVVLRFSDRRRLPLFLPLFFSLLLALLLHLSHHSQAETAQYRLVADGLHIGLLADQYIPPIPRGTMRNSRL